MAASCRDKTWETAGSIGLNVMGTVESCAKLVPADDAERQRALDIARSFLVGAPAGSGKTELLTQRALVCLAAVERPEEVLVLTFTNKAVDEARSRILDALALGESDVEPGEPHRRRTWKLARAVNKHAIARDWHLKDNPARLRVMTIDSLCSSLVRQLPILSGLGGSARVEENPIRLYEEAVRHLFAEIEEDIDESLRDALRDVLAFSRNRIDQITPFLVRLLQTRDQWLGFVSGNHDFEMDAVLSDLIVSRLRIAESAFAEEYRRRAVCALQGATEEAYPWIRGVGCWPAATIDSVDQWRRLSGALLTSTDTLRRKVTVRDGFPPKNPATLAMNELLKELHENDVAEEIEGPLADVRALPDPVYPEQLDAFRRAVSVVLKRLVAHLHVVFAERGAVDFSEVAQRALLALGDDDTATEILLRQDYLIRHILLDEAQDTSALQYRLLLKISSGWQANDGRTFFIVGDPQQSIYSFRQAEVGLFLDLERTRVFGEVRLEPLRLTTNFRSDAVIVDWFNEACSRIFPAGADPYASVVTFSASTKHRSGDTSAAVVVHPFGWGHDREEAQAVARIAKESIERNPEASVAILVRSRSHLDEVLPALKSAGVTYTCTDISPLAESPAVNDVMALVRALWHPVDREAWLTVLRAPFVGLSWADCVALVRGFPYRPVIDLLRTSDVAATLSQEGQRRVARLVAALNLAESDAAYSFHLRRKAEAIWHVLGGLACVTPSEAEDVRTFLGLLDRYCCGGEMKDFEGFMGAMSKLYASPEAGHVQVMTIHKAKGLEFDVVILPGLGAHGSSDDPPLLRYRGLPAGVLIAPHPGNAAPKESPEARLYGYIGRLEAQARASEELRLLYVAVTRARSQMHLLGQVLAPGKGTGWRARSGSLLRHLWPVLSQEFEVLSPTLANPAVTRTVGVPVAPRLSPDWAAPSFGPTFIPQEDRTDLPSELVLKDQPDDDWCSENVADRLVGTMYHAFVDRIAKEGIANWNDARVAEQAGSLRAGCRRLGVPEPQIEAVVARIVELVRNTIACDRGRWILGTHEWSASEMQLAGYVHGHWRAAQVDRAFAVGGDLWVIDYKTSGGGTAPAKVEAFLQAELQKYADQLDRYAEDIARLRNWSGTVRRGLYFPALKRLAVAVG